MMTKGTQHFLTYSPRKSQKSLSQLFYRIESLSLNTPSGHLVRATMLLYSDLFNCTHVLKDNPNGDKGSQTLLDILTA
jgi:hypothetical protein